MNNIEPPSKSLKLICCNVFLREACWCVARSPHRIDPEFLELGEHVQPDRLRASLQSRIDAAEASPKTYDAICLLYGLCGNAAVGLQARRTPLVLPRAHDCATILLGSRQRFQEVFGDHPSRPFGSVGYWERGNYFVRTEEGGLQIREGDQFAALVEQYGEDNARYIWESLHGAGDSPEDSQLVFIHVPETTWEGCEACFRERASQQGKTCLRAEGSLTLIRRLLDGDWDPEEFLLVKPGERTVGVYDWTEIIRSQPEA